MVLNYLATINIHISILNPSYFKNSTNAKVKDPQKVLYWYFTRRENETVKIIVFYYQDIKVVSLAGLFLEFSLDQNTDFLIGYKTRLPNIKALGIRYGNA